MAERVHLLLLSPGGATETPFNRPRRGSNGMTKANTFTATRSTGPPIRRADLRLARRGYWQTPRWGCQRKEEGLPTGPPIRRADLRLAHRGLQSATPLGRKTAPHLADFRFCPVAGGPPRGSAAGLLPSSDFRLRVPGFIVDDRRRVRRRLNVACVPSLRPFVSPVPCFRPAVAVSHPILPRRSAVNGSSKFKVQSQPARPEGGVQSQRQFRFPTPRPARQA
jgi:hypothetical protein